MSKKLIHPEGYQEPFEDRRQRVTDVPPLTGDFKSWWPIWSSLAGLLIVLGVWLTTVKSTAVLANTTACDVRIIDNRVTKLETVVNTELPIVKGDIAIIKDDVKKLLQTMSALKSEINYRNNR